MTPTVWQRAMAWVEVAGDFDPDAQSKRIKAAGFTAVALMMHDGTDRLNAGKVKSWRGICNPLGVLVGGWGMLQGEPEAEATLASSVTREEGAQFYIADAEFAYKKSLGDPGDRAARFCTRYRSLRPTFATALSYLPNEAVGDDMTWAPWRGANFRGLPQCYPNEFPDSPNQWPEGAMAAAAHRFPRSWVHPTLGIYGGKQDVHAAAYISSLKRAKSLQGFTYGYSVFLLQHLNDTDILDYKAVNRPAGTTGADVLAWY